ncbi:MFS transporter [Amaricoccus tamworthensis]|uniref:MFS transporter n=1 Tax=Amaricoccus tamworthensis TaxID=57002 RepID=UPI003C7B3F40
MQPDQTTRSDTQTGRAGPLCLALAMFLASLGTSIANIALPDIAAGFDAGFDQVQWVAISFLAALTVTSPVAGRLGDRVGRRQALILGLSVFTLGSALCALAPGLHALVAARALQGAGAAFLMTLTIALVHATAPANRVGHYMGLLGTTAAIGTAFGPSLGGFLVAWLDWRATFAILIPGTLPAIWLAWSALPADAPTAVTPAPEPVKPPLRQILPGLTANLLVAMTMMSTLIVGPFFLNHGLGLSAAAAGLVLSTGPAIAGLCGIPSGRVVDRWGTTRALALGLTGLTTGAFALAFLPLALGITGYILAIILLTPGYQLFQVANNTAFMSLAPTSARGTVSGLLNLSRNLGFVAGASLMGAVFAFGTGADVAGDVSPAAISNGMRLVYLLAGGLMACAFIITRPRREKPGDTRPMHDMVPGQTGERQNHAQ